MKKIRVHSLSLGINIKPPKFSNPSEGQKIVNSEKRPPRGSGPPLLPALSLPAGAGHHNNQQKVPGQSRPQPPVYNPPNNQGGKPIKGKRCV